MPEYHVEPSLLARLIRLETQIARIIADIESEKRTRSNVNSDIYDRLDDMRDRFDEKLEKIIEGQARNARTNWSILGGLAVLNTLAPFVIPAILRALHGT